MKRFLSDLVDLFLFALGVVLAIVLTVLFLAFILLCGVLLVVVWILEHLGPYILVFLIFYLLGRIAGVL